MRRVAVISLLLVILATTGCTVHVTLGGWYPWYGGGWTAGHEELRYDPHTGTYYRVWVGHRLPGTYP